MECSKNLQLLLDKETEIYRNGVKDQDEAEITFESPGKLDQ